MEVGKFRMYGRIVQLYRWQVDYDLDGEPITEKYPTEDEADAAVARTGGTKAAIDVTGDEWIDGIEVIDVPDAYAEATKIYEAGPPYVPPVSPETKIADLEAQLNALLGVEGA